SHGIIGGGKSDAVPEFGPDEDRREVADAEEALLECPTTWLELGESHEVLPEVPEAFFERPGAPDLEITASNWRKVRRCSGLKSLGRRNQRYFVPVSRLSSW